MARYRTPIVRLGGFGLAAATLTLALGAMLASATVAVAADPPVWKIVSTSEPTNLASPRSEVDELTVTATGGIMLLVVNGSNFAGIYPYNVSAEALQSGLEEHLGAGNVEVTGGPGDASGSKPYVITFTGELTGQEVPLRALGPFPGEEGESVSVKVATKAADGGTVVLTAINVGGPTDGSTVTIADSLPAQLVSKGVVGFERYGKGVGAGLQLPCKQASLTFMCSYSDVMETGDSLTVRIPVTVQPGAPASVPNAGTVAGGGAEIGASLSTPLTISATPASFGVAPGSTLMAVSSRQAGGHPDVTTSFEMATSAAEQPAGNVKDVRVDLPPGLVGNTVGMPRCSTAHALTSKCPRDTVVGVATVSIPTAITSAGIKSPEVFVNPVFNIEPSPGEPAAFMFTTVAFPVRLDTSVLSNGDYAVRVTASDISEAAPVLGSSVTIWGVPADHEGPGPIKLQAEADSGTLVGGLGGPATEVTRVPLITNPTQCSSSLTGRLDVDEWGNRDVFSGESSSLGAMTGCGALAFSGGISMLPDTLEAGAPAGYDFNLHVPQVNDPNGLSQPNVKRVVTALPMGTVVSPSAAVGLKACSDEQFFGPVAERGLERQAKPGECPRDSQVGTVSIRTPALALPLTGDVYLATPDCEPCSPQDAQDGKMVRLFVQVVGEGDSGIVVKLEGHTSLNQQTGQLTATFDNNPQLPFSDFKLVLAGGSRATLANSRVCGPVSTSLDMQPWSNPFTTDVSAISTFEVNQGCITPRFDPSFVAGTTNIQAGAYSPFTLSFGRADADEFLDGLQMQMPQGLLGSLAGIPLCKEPQASAGTCSAGSLIGHTQVLTGPGQTPFLVTGGQVFLTEGYKGAPFGLSIVVPAKAGPFTLSGTTGTGAVVVRAAINIDPHTTALTVTSDPLPTALDGIPLQLKVVNVTIDRPGFTFNPTDCARTAITGTLSSKESGGAHVSSPFQVTNCAGLGFKPLFKVSTSGHTSRTNGANLDAKVIYPTGSKYANIAKVKVDLPKQLPSRLTTLQKACPAATFDANPGNCPKASVVGIARASTPILPVKLTGPAYFVSHGGEAFPNLIVVLQGYGVRVDLIGDTFISKAGITSSTFNQVPDVPINSFELYLPQGPNSALAANGNLCNSKLKMPTSFIAQNGARVRQSTAIAVTGCNAKASKAKKARRARTAREHRSSSVYAAGNSQSNAANRRNS
jgi:hypothetical protein